MRERVIFPAVLAAALAVSVGLLYPRLRSRLDAPPPEPPPVELPPPPAPEPAPAPPPPPPPPPPSYVRIDPAAATACKPGMVLVDGVYCPFVAHRCTSFLVEERDVCQSFAPEVLCEGALQRRRFCMDIHEYPNLEGVRPAVMVDYNDARRACAVEKKRLCLAEEWEFACEGPQMWPYPYGSERDPARCNIDKPQATPELDALSDAGAISAEIEHLDQRVASGAMPGCVSPFGVRDMTGNVDEWVENRNGKRLEQPFRSGLKGGHWGPVRARCRPMTTSYSERFRFYQAGFRCCSDAKGGRAVSRGPTTRPRQRPPDRP